MPTTAKLFVMLGAAAAAVVPAIPASAALTEAEIADFSFSPDPLTIAVGDSVKWTNADNASHTVTADDGAFNSGTLAAQDTFTQTFSDAGTFTYHCAIHPSMRGTIQASAATTTTAAPTSTTSAPTTTITTAPTTTTASPTTTTIGEDTTSPTTAGIAPPPSTSPRPAGPSTTGATAPTTTTAAPSAPLPEEPTPSTQAALDVTSDRDGGGGAGAAGLGAAVLVIFGGGAAWWAIRRGSRSLPTGGAQ